MKSDKNKRKLGKQSNEVSQVTKNRILIAALEIFARDGFHKAGLRDIAALAGTTHNLIRHHFGSKDDLWKAAVDYKIQIHADNLRQIIYEAGSMDPVSLLKSVIKAFISYTAKNPELARISLGDYSRKNSHVDYIFKKQKVFLDLTFPIFKKVQLTGYFKNYNHETFGIYLTSLVETPIVTSYYTSKIMKIDICSKKGIALHTKHVMEFLFKKDE
jgi:TetR/AcrR family transcriptional regulator